ncbi:MAG TPA: type II toxin-antitoxin system ParD family antitoxin [Candidatus Angelobacter sp.]|jgi:antitoxin ParD1/3/4|nr:type II toxin-antitoxin system ParD family antitoxin [Candidatus Angelobacter sp.]
MHVNLTPTLDEYVLAKVKSGRYNNASEVVRDALRKMQDGEARENPVFPNLTPKELDEVRRKVSQGSAEIERGEGIECEDEEDLRRFFDEVRAEAHRKLLNKRRRTAKR